ncbi:Ubiquinone biosynthesis monooxygenase COQ6, mitochondrial [Mycena sanguinolenta]|uniref:Ubiquinone biosynthesis monooxygenase COQ6, mitochondrial n=1 Tax=Mycena sanguinolenta TaxID=230812 RepID=A0A8H6Z4A7_9AGAR|nr:Ubiquinone biosynthesis monooxygenase COQ6, mitochondrial [Mycena sanguinolenta]
MPLPSSTVYRRAAGHFRRSFRRSISTSPPEEYDVVIVGGGPAGLALASALGSSQLVRESLRVALVEASDLSKVLDWTPAAGTFSNRASSLTNKSQTFLKDIGAWNYVDEERTCPIQDMQVWDGVSDARIDFSASLLGLGSPGQGMARMTENLNLQRVQILDKLKVQTIERPEGSGDWPLVHLDNGGILRSRLLVGADGFNSPVRSFAKISSYGWAYDTQAIVATMFHSPRGAFMGPNTTAFQRFLPTGPIAFLPLSPIASSLVWSTKPPLATALIASGPVVLGSMINAAFRLPDVSMRYLNGIVLDAHASGNPVTASQIQAEIAWRERSHGIDETSAYTSIIDVGKQGIPPADAELLPPLVTSLQPGTVASFPLRFNHTDSYLGEGQGSRTVLVGDAAHTVHPLAGQGLNLGLADVECLSRCIQNALLQGGDVGWWITLTTVKIQLRRFAGSRTALVPYGQERYFENHKIMSVMDKLHKLYSTSFEPVVWARSVGLEVVNELDSVKAALMMQASGKRLEDASPWDIGANVVESLAAATDTARVVGTGVSGMLGAVLQGALKAVGNASSQSKH